MSTSSSSGSKPSGMWQPPTLEEMQAMLPQYRFESLLGRGGMGAVYKAVQVSLDRPVAVKVLPGDLIDDTDAQFAERFKNEARTMAKMNHPSIVNVYDFGETQTGLLYIVMEFIDGTDVAKMITSQGKLPPDYALAITAHVSDALNYAHKNGIIHRDIKPANILINMEGAVKVADFGLAKQSDAGMSGLTKTNMAMGTPDFVAPEALIPGVPLDGRADLYAIGVMLYQMLTGEIPRGMWTMPGTKLGTDPRFDAIIGKAMQTDRELRYQSAAEIRQDLDTILTTPRAKTQPQQAAAQKPQPQGQKPVEQPPVAPLPPKKANLGMIMGLGVTAVLLIGGYFFLKPPAPLKKTATAASAPVAPPKPAPPPPAQPKSTPASLPPPPQRVAKQTLDLLALTDPVLDRITVPGLIGKNDWVREGASLVYQSDGKAGKLAAPVAFNCRDYEIELRAERRSGSDRIHFDVPLAKGRIVPLTLNSPGRKVVHEREGRPWGKDGAVIHVTVRVMLSQDGRSDRIVIQRKDTNETMADWTGSLDKLGKAGEAHPGFPGRPVASVFVMKDPHAIKTWTLRVFEGEATSLRTGGAPSMAQVPAQALTTPTVMPKTELPMPVPAALTTTPPSVSDPVALKLADLEVKFQAAFDRDAGAAYKTQVATLNTGYAAALDRALVAASKAGNLDEAVALREEKERMTSGKGLPPEDLDTLPESLKKLRGTWRGTEAGYAKQRDTKATPLFDAYDKALDAFQTELTRQNKIDDALRVKATRDELVQRRASSAPAAEVTSAPAKSATPAPAGAVAVESSSSWRKAAEWILSVGGEVRVRRSGSSDATVKDAKDLPSGRFDIIAIMINVPPAKGALITDDDLTRLNGLRSIETVEMVHLTSITGAGLAALAASADTMRKFVLYDVPVQPQHIGFITQFKKLQWLELNSLRGLTSEALAKLGVMTSLDKLRLLEAPGLDDRALLAFSNLTKLRELELVNTKVTDEGLVALKGMKALDDLDLSGSKSITGSGLVHLAAAKDLAHLKLTFIAMTDASLAHLSGFTKLRDLTLNQTPVTDEGVRHLAPLKELRTLNIACKGVTGATLNLLSGCKDLTSLHLYDRTNPDHSAVNDAGLQAIAAAGFPKLDNFSYVQRQVSDAGLAHLSALKLKRLTTNTCPGLEGLRHLAKITTLESLELGRSDLTDDGLALLAGLKSLQTLSSFDAHVTDEGLKHLQTMPALKSATFSETKITQAAMDALMKARPGLKLSK